MSLKMSQEISEQRYTNKTAFGVIEKFDAVNDDCDIKTDQFLKECTEVASILGMIFFSP